jgi:3-hydroxyisobutyrate dehydrogenase-like beta-hydroxyacid dehydrogenase
MGVPMVRNLAAKGYRVTAYNRTRRSVDIGQAQLASSIADAVDGADAIILMVSDGSAVRSVLFGEGGVVAHARRGALIVNMSTIGVQETKELADELADRGLELMDAPVSGSVGPARDGTLVVLAGGSKRAFEQMEPLFLTMAKAAYHLGPVGSGAAMKLLINAMLGITVAAASECMAVAEKAGLGKQQFLEVLAQTAMWSPILAAKQGLWSEDEYAPAFALKHMTKDLGLMSEYAVQLSAAMPTVSATLNTYLQAQADGLAELDMAAVYRYVAKAVGGP